MDLTGAAWRKSSYSGSNDGACAEVTSVWRKSSHSRDNGGDCVEVADLWRKSSRSGSNGGACVEVGTTGRAVAIRDSKDPSGPALAFAPRAWQAFADDLKSST